MDISTWLAYLVVTITCTATPGTAIILAMSNSIAFGWHRVIFSSLGNILGVFIVSSCAMAGLGACLKHLHYYFLY